MRAEILEIKSTPIEVDEFDEYLIMYDFDGCECIPSYTDKTSYNDNSLPPKPLRYKRYDFGYLNGDEKHYYVCLENDIEHSNIIKEYTDILDSKLKETYEEHKQTIDYLKRLIKQRSAKIARKEEAIENISKIASDNLNTWVKLRNLPIVRVALWIRSLFIKEV